MATSGNVQTVTFTPDATGDLLVTATFQAGSVGSDWGAGAAYKLFMTQDGVTTYGAVGSTSTTRMPYSVKHLFPNVAQGLEIVCGLFGQVSGASAMSFYNIQITAELHRKRV